MADFVKGLFGGAQPSPVNAPSSDADFADFAAAPSPEAAASPVSGQIPARQTAPPFVWYNVHHRVSLQDFYAELFILPCILALVAFHLWGTKKNRNKAKSWVSAHSATLASEFAVVGFGGGKRQPSADDVATKGLAQASENATLLEPESLIKEKGKDVYLSYATGRQNVAFVDIKLTLLKRYNPLTLFTEGVVSFFFESIAPTVERADVIAYAFDGREKEVVPTFPGMELDLSRRSTFDAFVWAVVHKDRMKALRDERYDLSLTTTKENAKLPDWATVMSESAEVTDLLLTNELVSAIKALGDDFESLIVTDLPEDAPKSLNDLQPKKRLLLTTRIGGKLSTTESNNLLSIFLRMPDYLVSSVKLRPEVTKKIKATRDEESRKIKKLEEQEKAEGRKADADKARKEDREKKLKGLSAEEQRKFLEKERERDQRKMMGRRTMKG